MLYVYHYTGCIVRIDDSTQLQDMKLRYYELMIKLALQEDNYLDACKAWQEVWDTEDVKNNEQQNIQVSSCAGISWCFPFPILIHIPLGNGAHHHVYRPGPI